MSDERGSEASGGGGHRGRWVWAAALAAIFTAMVGPMVWLESGRTNIPPDRADFYPSEVYDQDEYHWSVIRGMEGRWPGIELVEYDSATTPGYHWVMAGVLEATGSRTALLVVNAGIGLGLVLVLWWCVSGVVGGWRGAVLAMPLAMSPYTLGGSIWMTTDNLALLFVTLVLGLGVLRRFTIGRAGVMGLAATGAVLVRQVHVWPVALIGLAGLLRSPLARLAPKALLDESRQTPRSWAMLIAAVVAAGVPVVVLGVFVVMWGGLMPRSEFIRSFHAQGPNFASPALALTIVGAYGLFFAGVYWDEVRRVRMGDWRLWLAAGAGLASGLVVETSYWTKPRSYGWVWSMVERFELIVEPRAPWFGELERSPLIALGAAVGAAVLVLMHRSARAAGNGAVSAMLLLSLVGWLCAQTMNTMAWQRYFDPIVLIGLAMLGALCAGAGGGRAGRWAWAGPVALALGLAALAGLTNYREFLELVL